jgi:long-chain acyl-CoA synthetase
MPASSQLLHHFLERSASLYPSEIAVVFKDEQLSWANVDKRSARIANALIGLGVERGDRVCLYLDNSIELCVAIFGVLRVGAVFCVINAATKADKLGYILGDCRAKVLISNVFLASTVDRALKTKTAVEHLVYVCGQETLPEHESLAAVHDLRQLEQRSADKLPSARPSAIEIDLASIIYTSGTTADPKGVMLTHRNMVSAVESITQYLENRQTDRVLSVLPLSFDYGLYQWLMVASFGGRLVLERSFSYPAPILALIEKERCTGFSVVPTIAAILGQYAKKGLTLPSLRYVTNTAAALAPAHIETLRTICPNARIFSMYGLTECKRVSYLPPEQLSARPDSVGKTMPNMEAFIVDENGDRVPPGVVGELVIRGPQVMKGYWEKPAETAERLKPGRLPGEMWLYSGDLFRCDDEGYLYFVSRRDNIIKSRGEKVSPKEVEGALFQIDGVLDAAVGSAPDDVLGEAIWAFLVLLEGVELSPRQIIAAAARRLEPFMVPKYVTFLSSLPKTSSGKTTTKDIFNWAKRHRVGGHELT